jgi:hypothetical protein
LNNSYATTDLSIAYPGSPVYSGPSETDIIYQATGSLPFGLNGVTWCEDAQSISKCDQAYVRFLPDTPSQGLACHETGHAVGLTHGRAASPRLDNDNPALGCLTDPVADIRLLDNNVDNIDATY